MGKPPTTFKLKAKPVQEKEQETEIMDIHVLKSILEQNNVTFRKNASKKPLIRLVKEFNYVLARAKSKINSQH